MRDLTHRFFICLLACSTTHALLGQSPPQAPGEVSSSSAVDSSQVQLEQKLGAIALALATTRQQLEQSQRQIQQLQEELTQVRTQLGTSTPVPEKTATAPDPQVERSSDLQERVETLEAQVKLHDQTKLESSSKYPIRISGLLLFNSFINRGTVDNIDLPSIATNPTIGSSSGSAGAGLRQTILGIEGFGPRIAGARTSADITVDFFGGIPYSNFGTASGLVRLRTASINFDWTRDSLQVGMEAPLISPLSPTSYATVAEPGMAWAGNLWTWAPQIRYAHQFSSPNSGHFKLEAGLWDPPAAGYNTTNVFFRAPSSGEQAEQPAYEGRVSYSTAGEERNLQIGVGGYYSRQSYPNVTSGEYPTSNNSWAFTTDWRVPFAHRFEVSGEGYRGQSLGGLGGGVYKDVLYGTNPISGAAEMIGLNDIGGWTQFKSRFGRTLEANASIGLDNGFAGDFHAIVLPPTATATLLRARNRMVVGNLIFKPKTYLILSPEYRRIWTWPITGTPATANVFTLSVGYQF
jgi:hypothetical protein